MRHSRDRLSNLGTLDLAQVMAMTMQDWLKCDDPQARIMSFYFTEAGLKLLTRPEEAGSISTEGREGGPSNLSAVGDRATVQRSVLCTLWRAITIKMPNYVFHTPL